MNRSAALAWLYKELGRETVNGESIANLVKEVRDKYQNLVNRHVSAEWTGHSELKLHELDYHVIPALEVP